MKTEPLKTVSREITLGALEDDQIEALETWYRELHGLTECDTLRSIIGHGSMWKMNLGDWIKQEEEIAAEVAAREEAAQ